MRWFLVFLSGLALHAQELCGVNDQVVCLQNSTAVGFQCSGFGPGSVLLISVASLQTEGGLNQIMGPAIEPYWFELSGTVTDSTGGVWSAPQSYFSDARGPRAIGFELLSGLLVDQVLISLNQIQVCQTVGDGPGPVLLDIQLEAVLAKDSFTQLTYSNLLAPGFEACRQFISHPPLVAGQIDALYVNPHDEPMTLSLNSESQMLAPHAQLILAGDQAVQVMCGVAPPGLLRNRSGDLDLVGLAGADQDSHFFAHLAGDATRWQNRFLTASGGAQHLQAEWGGLVLQTSGPVGPLAWTLSESPGKGGFCTLNGSAPLSALVHLQRTDRVASSLLLGASPLKTAWIVPHLAADRVHFWTGLSLANPNSSPAEVTLYPYDLNGQALATTQRSISALANDVVLVEETLVPNTAAWLLVTANRPITGALLFGGQDADLPYSAGTEWMDQAHTNLVFPLIAPQSPLWTGLVFVNPSGQTKSGLLTTYQADGTVVDTRPIEISAMGKQVILLEGLGTHAIYRGDPLVGSCLMGDLDRTQLGAYNALIP
ncbi:MAG: hypothetical protein H6510_01940 [Acidobacteria bacterium]|nr:hypothetical protein [Acidobacteriota bacterium]MCB9396553.1 hypothetical protein [Acidobacteriota bacterium]